MALMEAGPRIPPLRLPQAPVPGGNRGPKKVFKLDARGYILTYPQNETTKEAVMDRLKAHDLYDDMQYVVVCEEDHHDTEGKHLHVTIVWKKKKTVLRPAEKFDQLALKHGNYQGCKDIFHCIAYTKKDGNWIEWGDEPIDTRAPKKDKGPGKSQLAMKAIDDGRAITGPGGLMFDPELGAHVMFHLNKFLNYKSLKEQADQAALMTELDLEPFHWYAHFGSDFQWSLVAQAIVDNLIPGALRQTRQKGLWITGPTAMGKTMLRTHLMTHVRSWMVPYAHGFMDNYDPTARLMFFDEFIGMKNGPHALRSFEPDTLNDLVDGAPMHLNKKGIAGEMKVRGLFFFISYPSKTLF